MSTPTEKYIQRYSKDYQRNYDDIFRKKEQDKGLLAHTVKQKLRAGWRPTVKEIKALGLDVTAGMLPYLKKGGVK